MKEYFNYQTLDLKNAVTAIASSMRLYYTVRNSIRVGLEFGCCMCSCTYLSNYSSHVKSKNFFYIAVLVIDSTLKCFLHLMFPNVPI